MTETDDYKRGFYDGFKAARSENHHELKIHPTQPIRTEDIMWPRDYPNITNPWPPKTVVYQACGVCGIGGDINKAMSFVCNNPQCPTRVTCTTTGTSS